MATKFKNTSKATKTSNKSKSLKRSTRKNGSGVSQRDIDKANMRLRNYIDRDTDSLGYNNNVREQQQYVKKMEIMYRNKKEFNAKQYQDYAKQIQNGKNVKIPLRQRFNPFSSHGRNLNALHRSQYSNVNRHGGETKKKTAKRTSKKIAKNAIIKC